jgi:hypothetical protein
MISEISKYLNKKQLEEFGKTSQFMKSVTNDIYQNGGNTNIKSCCAANPQKGDKKCIRTSDQKTFDISSRRFTKSRCVNGGPLKGFTMRASCAPYKDC